MAITGASWTSVSKVTISFDAAVDPSYINRPVHWTIAATAPSPAVSIYRAKTKTGNLTVDVRVGPNAIPGAEYTISATPSAGGATVSVVTTCPANLSVPQSAEWSHGLLRSLTSTFGEASQRFNGHPQTLTISEVSPKDSRIFVESTLGFPASGVIVCEKKSFKYIRLEPMAFVLKEASDQFKRTAPKTLVSLHVRSHLPD